MSRQGHSYLIGTTPSRAVANHSNSSAFSSSANPDEDWTKISDLAERRRIQNRIAQRNYRKKLKRRLEDLERRAGSSSESPPQTHANIHHLERANDCNRQYKRSPETVPRQLSSRPLQNQYAAPVQNDHDLMFSHGFEREGSRTPPLFDYHSYPAPEDIGYSAAYPHSQQYRQVTTICDRSDTFADYLAPIPVSLPSMIHFDSYKRDGIETLSPFGMSYQGLPALDIHSSQSYSDSNPHTPPLSNSYEHSTDCSESGYQYPSTPLSMPPSPRMADQI